MSEEVLDRLNFIKSAQTLGFTLDEIASVIAEKRRGQTPCARVREIVRRRLHELDERMAQMRRHRRELAAALAEWEKSHPQEAQEVTPLVPAGEAHDRLDHNFLG